MAVRRTVLRVGAVLAGLTALGVALPTLASSQQRAARHRSGEPKSIVQKCCDVRVRDAARTVLAGGAPASVTATVAAGRNGCTNVHPRITVSLAGLDPDEIRIERVVRGTPLSLPVRAADDGAVQAADPVRDGVRLCGDGRANLAYRLTFLAGAPAGRATMSAEAGTRDGRVLGRDATFTVVRAAAAREPATAQQPAAAAPPPAANAPADRGAGPAEQGGAAPKSDADSPSATDRAAATVPGRLSATLVATGLGAVVAVTVALVCILVLRQRRRGDEPDEPAARPGRRPGAPGRQPTLAARWSSLVSTVRRPPGPVGGGS